VLTPPHFSALLVIRSRWRRTCQETAILRVCLLASYPIEPLVPYLGIGLLDAGLRPAVRVGPTGRNLQQCLSLDDAELVRFRPDVVVVAPRFEEAPTEQAGGRRRRDPGRGLLAVADAAVAARVRLGCLLVFVLPAVPERGPASASALRDDLRARLAGVPGICVADAQEAVRHVGAHRARRTALVRGAAPYTEELFASLAAQLVRMLRVHYGMTWRAVVMDADSLLLPARTGVDLRPAVEALRGPLRALHRRGVRLALRAGPACDGLWDVLAADFPDLVSASLDASVIDERPVEAQLRAIAANTDVPADQTVLLTADPDLAARVGGGLGHPRAVLLTGEPAAWPATMREVGIFDCVPGDPGLSVPSQ
jgi:hypothetical protein